MILRITSLLCILIGFSSISQEDLSATRAVFIALENNYQMQIAAKQHAINQKNNSWSEAGLFPTVTLNVAQNNTIQDNRNNPFTFTPGIILNQSINPSLNLDWNLFSGFKVTMSKQRLAQLEEQSANNVIAVMETTIQDVLKAYFTVQLQKDRLDLFEDVMSRSRRNFKLYELKEKYSTSTSLESLQFRNQYLTDSSNYRMQLISYENAKRNLYILMNVGDSVEPNYRFTDDLDALLPEVNTTSAEEDLFASNANLKNQYINLELQRTNTAFQRSFLWPTLSFSAGAQPSWSRVQEIQNNAFEADINTLSYYGNLNLRYTIFNNWKNKRAVEVSKIQEEIASLNVESIKRSLSSTLKNLIDLYEARQDLVNISTENLGYAQKAYDLAEKRFELGTINSVDLSNFQTAYQNTMIQHYENLFNRMDTYLEIYKMTGKLSLDYNGEN